MALGVEVFIGGGFQLVEFIRQLAGFLRFLLRKRGRDRRDGAEFPALVPGKINGGLNP